MSWNPSQPLPNADDETEAIDRANKQARVEYLKLEALKSAAPPPDKKKKKGWD